MIFCTGTVIRSEVDPEAFGTQRRRVENGLNGSAGALDTTSILIVAGLARCGVLVIRSEVDPKTLGNQRRMDENGLNGSVGALCTTLDGS